MTYPTLDQVNASDLLNLCRWHRFLPSPGTKAIGESPECFFEQCNRESSIIDRIRERIASLGGITPEISKAIDVANKLFKP